MTHRCLNCYTPMFENHTDGLFCFKCGTVLNILKPFYDVIKGLNAISKSWLNFSNDTDDMIIRFEEGKAILSVMYDKKDKDYTIYIEFHAHMVFAVSRKTVTMKALRKILTEHAGIFGNKDYTE